MEGAFLKNWELKHGTELYAVTPLWGIGMTMIESIPRQWRAIRARVGDSVDIPIHTEVVSVVPTDEGAEEVTVSFYIYDFAEEFDFDPETESRPVRAATIQKGETSRFQFPEHQTIVPASDGESATIYHLGRTDEERRMLY